MRVLLITWILLGLAAPAVEAGRAQRSRPAGSAAARTAQGQAVYGHGVVHHGWRGVRPYGPYYYLGWPYYRGAGWYPAGPAVWTAGLALTANLPGAVETDVSPGRAELWLDGERIGRARDFNGRWDVLDLSAGDHLLEFRRDGYLTLQRHVRVRPGELARIELHLAKGSGLDPRSTAAPPPAGDQRAPETGSLVPGLVKIEVAPQDAAVYLDGEFLAHGSELERLHGALSVASGRHVVEVVRPGYESSRIEIEVNAEEPSRVRVALEPIR